MGIKYEGSVKQKVDGAIISLYNQGVVEITKTDILQVVADPHEISSGTIDSIFSRYIKRGALSSTGRRDKNRLMIYSILNISWIGKPILRRGDIRNSDIKRVATSTTSSDNDILNGRFTLDQLGDAVYRLLIRMGDREKRIERELTDVKIKLREQQVEYRREIEGRDKKIKEFQESLDVLRNRKGTFSLAEIAGIDDEGDNTAPRNLSDGIGH